MPGSRHDRNSTHDDSTSHDAIHSSVPTTTSTITTANEAKEREKEEGHDEEEEDDGDDAVQQTNIGRLVFPDYKAGSSPDEMSWTKRVYLYVGMHQRLTGEVKKLPKALAIVRKKRRKSETRERG